MRPGFWYIIPEKSLQKFVTGALVSPLFVATQTMIRASLPLIIFHKAVERGWVNQTTEEYGISALCVIEFKQKKIITSKIQVLVGFCFTNQRHGFLLSSIHLTPSYIKM